MSLVDNKGVAIFPVELIRREIEKFKQEHSKEPKILCVSQEDYIDYTLSCTLANAVQFGLSVVSCGDLAVGEFALGSAFRNV